MQNRYPQLAINLKQIQANAQKMMQECKKRNFELVRVVKLVTGNLTIA